MQDTFIVHSVSHSVGGGIISSREYLDIVSNFTDSTKCTYLSCGKVAMKVHVYTSSFLSVTTSYSAMLIS